MIDLELLRKNPEAIKEAVLKKHLDVDIERILILDAERRTLIARIDEVRAERNQLSIEDMKTKGPELKLKLKELEDQLSPIEKEFQEKILFLPNNPHFDVPEGKDESENKIIKTVGELPKFDFEPRDHEELVKLLDLADFDRASKVSGHKFYYLKNHAVILEMALLRFAMDFIVKKGFKPMTTPDMARKEAFYGAGHFPPEEDAYLTTDGLYLAGTAEIGLVNYHAGEIIDALPKRYAAFSACFRREAGSHGKVGGGLYRVHQFHKVEMVSLVKPEDSETEHEFLLALAEEFLSELELPYQVVDNCGGELGLPHYRKYDINTYMAGRGGYFETHSCSNDTDFQARRLGIKYQKEDGSKEYVHTLNNTVIASPRILIPLLENNQQEDGSVKIPKALVPYCGFEEIRIRGRNQD